ncbi:MAG: hypothetical protein M1820_002446 [Bogoriella megaspora]|nr:MAG: hypothetical protein M1820_002446 [Bogoriella megaspora]
MTSQDESKQAEDCKGKERKKILVWKSAQSSSSNPVFTLYHNIYHLFAFVNIGLLAEFLATVFTMSKKFVPEDIPNLSGKVILVTGGNTGLGKDTILQLSKHSPKEIFLGARTQGKAEAAIHEIQQQVPDAKITHLPLDLTSFPSIFNAAEQFKSKASRLDILIHNAGIMAVPYSLTPQNHEIQFGTNHTGPFLLTKLLLPTLLSTAEQPNSDVRVITVSSSGHHMAPWAGIVYEQEKLQDYGPWRRYGQSKLANILFAQELAKRHPKITSVAVHPGVIQTDLYASQIETNFIVRNGLKLASMTPIFTTVEEGAMNQLWAATMPKVESGKYYVPVGKVNGGSFWHAQKPELARALWDWSEAECKKHGFE